MIRTLGFCSAAALAAALAWSAPAQALTMKECGAKYQAAKQANTLKGMKWNDFRKAECGDEDASDAEAAAAVKEDAAPEPAGPAKTATKAGSEKAPQAKPATTGAAQPAAPAAGGKVTFPKEIAAKYASETPGKARLHTCVDQYNANKATGGNGELKWIMKGGGYYSQCNAKLKS
jgi:hypothetical protein